MLFLGCKQKIWVHVLRNVTEKQTVLKHLNDLEIRNSQSFFEDVMIFMLIYNIRFEDYCFLGVDFPIQQWHRCAEPETWLFFNAI